LHQKLNIKKTGNIKLIAKILQGKFSRFVTFFLTHETLGIKEKNLLDKHKCKTTVFISLKQRY